MAKVLRIFSKNSFGLTQVINSQNRANIRSRITTSMGDHEVSEQVRRGHRYPIVVSIYLDLDLDHIVATSLRILTATVLDSVEMLGPLEEKLVPTKVVSRISALWFCLSTKNVFLHRMAMPCSRIQLVLTILNFEF